MPPSFKSCGEIMFVYAIGIGYVIETRSCSHIFLILKRRQFVSVKVTYELLKG